MPKKIRHNICGPIRHRKISDEKALAGLSLRSAREDIVFSTEVPDEEILDPSEGGRILNQLRKSHGAGSGRPSRDAPRCPCGDKPLSAGLSKKFICCRTKGYTFTRQGDDLVVHQPKRRSSRNTPTEWPEVPKPIKRCGVAGCERDYYAKGLCHYHYKEALVARKLATETTEAG